MMFRIAIAASLILAGVAQGAVYNNIGNVKIDDVQYSSTAATSTRKTFPNYSTLQTIGRGGDGGISVASIKAPDAQATVSTLAALRTFDRASRVNYVYMAGRTTAGDGGAGVFRWDSSNLSVQVTADTLSGIYVAPTSALTGSGGAWVRVYSGAANVRWFGATGVAADDQTAAIQAAYGFVFALPTGGALYFPEGKYMHTGLNFSSATANYSKHVRLYGDNFQASWLICNTTGVGIDFLGTQSVQMENLYITNGTNSPTVGVLFARSTTAQSSTWHSIKNVQVWGNFTQAAMATICAETFSVSDSVFNNTNTNGGVSFFSGQTANGVKLDGTGAYTNFTVASANGTIFNSSNTDIAFFRCTFYGYGTANLPFSADGQMNATFTSCAFIPSSSLVTSTFLISDRSLTPFNGAVTFQGCIFESGYGNGIEVYSVRTSAYFQKINVIGSYFNLFGSNQYSITHSGTSTDKILVEFYYAGNSRQTSTPDVLDLDYVDRSFISVPRGEVRIRTTLFFCFLHCQTRTFTRSAELITWISNTYFRGASTSKPVSGVFIRGERRENSTPTAGGYAGWIATGSVNGAAWTSARANTTVYAVGTWIKFVGGTEPVFEVTATSGAGQTAGSQPSVAGVALGGTLTDGDLTLTLRANYPVTMKGYGAVEP